MYGKWNNKEERDAAKTEGRTSALKKQKMANKMSSHANLQGIFNPAHSKHLTAGEHQSSSDKYDAQRRRRR